MSEIWSNRRQDKFLDFNQRKKPPSASKSTSCSRLSGGARAYEVQKRAKKLGIFINDRELLTCPKCGLHEDVSSVGMLQVTIPPHLGEDTGLRFKMVGRRFGCWCCPACKTEFKAPDEPEF